ncbi:GAG-pre-integrase domain, partial [Rhizoctonia solani]
MPRPAGDDAKEAVGEAFVAFTKFCEVLVLYSAPAFDKDMLVRLIDGEASVPPATTGSLKSSTPLLSSTSSATSTSSEEDELPALLVIPTLLHGTSVAALLEIDEAAYRERCLSGFGRAEASEGVVVRAVLARLEEQHAVHARVPAWVKAPDFVHFCPSVGFAIIAAAECSLAGNRVGFAIIAAAEFSVPLQQFLQVMSLSVCVTVQPTKQVQSAPQGLAAGLRNFGIGQGMESGWTLAGTMHMSRPADPCVPSVPPSIAALPSADFICYLSKASSLYGICLGMPPYRAPLYALGVMTIHLAAPPVPQLSSVRYNNVYSIQLGDLSIHDPCPPSVLPDKRPASAQSQVTAYTGNPLQTAYSGAPAPAAHPPMIPPLHFLSVASSQAPTPAPVPTPVPVLVLAPASVCIPSAMARFLPLIPIYAPPAPVPTPAPTPIPILAVTPIPAPVPIHPAAPSPVLNAFCPQYFAPLPMPAYPPSSHMPAYPPPPPTPLLPPHVPYWPHPPMGYPYAAPPNAKVKDCKAFLAKMKSLSDLLKELKLEEGKYATWSQLVWDLLVVCGLEHFVDANFVPPNPANVRAYTNWVRCNGLVRKAIVCSLDSSQYPYVQENTTASSVWAALQEVHALLTKAWASSLRSQILLLRMPKGSLFKAHLAKLQHLVTEMSVLGQPISEGEQRHALISSLPHSWCPVILQLKLAPRPLGKTIQGLCAIAPQVAKLSLKSLARASDVTALSIQTEPLKNGTICCFDCCKLGHTKGSPNCKFYKHHIKVFGANCVNIQQKGKGRSLKDKNNKKKAKASIAVTNASSSEAPKAGEASAVEVLLWTPSAEDSPVQVLALAATGEHRLDSIIVNSGCSHHIVNNQAYFTLYRPFAPSKRPVISGVYSGIKGYAMGIGDVAIPTTLPRGCVWCRLTNVYHVPRCLRVLLSYWKLLAAGGSVAWNLHKATPVYGPGRSLLGIAMPSNYVWRIPINLGSCPSGEANTAIASLSVLEAVLWHRRFGHLGSANLSKLASGSLVKGLPTSLACITECNECALAKACRSLFPPSDSIAAALLELVHLDLCGPFPHLVGGSKYWMILLNNATRYCWVLLLKSKSDAFEAFKAWHKRITTQTGCVLKVLRSDNGGKYFSAQWSNYVADHGLVCQTSVPYSLQQNGRAEQDLWSLQDWVRAMMLDAGLPQGWWAETVTTAVYIMNQSPHSAIDVTPFEAWTGVCPLVSNLCAFGSKCFAVHTLGTAKTLDPCSTECQFLGYDKLAKAWRLRKVGTNQVLRARNVIFHETSSASPCPVTSYSANDLEAVFPTATLADKGGDNLLADQSDDYMRPDQTTNRQVGDSPEDDKPDPENQSIEPNWEEKAQTEKFQNGTATAVAIMPQPWVPSTYKQMLDSPDAKKWRKGTVDKFQSWKSLGVYKITRVPQTQRCLGTKPVYVAKTGADGAIEQFKVRYVVLGNLQREGINYGKTSSPTACPETLKIMVAVGTERNWEIHQMDIKTAYLHAKVNRKIYLQIPDGFPESELPSGIPCKELALQLNKAVYGLKQAGYLWICHAMQVFVEIGFTQLKFNPCLFFMNVSPNCCVWVLIYVDNFTILAPSPKTMSSTKLILSAAFQLKDLGEVKQILGLEINRDREKGTTRLLQRKYVHNLLLELGLENCKPIYSPMESALQLPVHGSEPDETPLSDKDIKFMRDKPYSRVLGSLNWLANGTRPDIVHACLFLGQHAKQPGPLHWMALMQIVRYLRTTYNSGIVFARGSGLTLVGYSDSDHGGDTRDYMSYTGYVFTLGGGAILHKAIKQSCVAKLSAEAEYAALYECATQSVWLRRLVSDFLLETSDPIKIWMDSQSAMKMALRNGFSGRTKHININYHYSRNLVRNKEITLTWVPGQENIADICTKPLPRPRFHELLSLLRFDVSFDKSTSL